VIITAVIFDFGNTLVSTRLNWAKILPQGLADLADALRDQVAELDFNRLGRDFLFFKKTAGQLTAKTQIEIPAIDTLQKAFDLQGLTSIPEEILQIGVDGFFAAEESAYPIIFGIPETLAKLKEMGMKLALVSNATCGQLVRRALSKRNLQGYFDHVAVSADLGPAKPDPAIFWGAMNAMEVQANNCVMVGDRLDTDIAGARRAGIRPVLADFFGDAPKISDDGPQPDVVVRHPDDLIRLFKTWQNETE
jgi:HAD superfamily hydrolase (TIGR01509 family)